MTVFTSDLKKKYGIKVILVLENTQLSHLLKNQGIKYPARVLEDFQGLEEQILSFYDSYIQYLPFQEFYDPDPQFESFGQRCQGK